MPKLVEIQAIYYAKIENDIRKASHNFICRFKKAFPNESIDEIFYIIKWTIRLIDNL